MNFSVVLTFSMACPESRLKCFLHYGCEDQMYIPSRNIKHSFHPEKVKSIIELLQNEEAQKNIVATIVKVRNSHYSYQFFL